MSIDTPLQSFDHVHPNAVIALAASSGGEELNKEIWGDKIGWLPRARYGRLTRYWSKLPICTV